MSSNLRIQTMLEGPWPLGQYRFEREAPFNTRIADDTVVFEPGGLVELDNLLVSERGTLYARPGIWKAFQGTNLDLTGATGIKILGRDSGFLANDMIVNITKSAANNRVGFVRADSDTIVGYNDFGATAGFGAAFGYAGLTYLFPAATNTPPTLGAGQKYNGASWSAQNLPGCSVALIWHDRAFAWDGSNLWWSKATDPTTWAAPDGGFAATALSGGVVDMFVFQNILYIIGVKKIWTFTFTSDPALDGYLRLLIDKLTVASTSLVNGRIYILASDGMYQLSNGYLIPVLKNKIEFPPGFGVQFLYMNAVGEYLIIGALLEFATFPNGTVAYIFNTRTGYISRITHHMTDFMALSKGISSDNTTLLIAGQDWSAYPTINYRFFKMRFSNEIPAILDTDLSGNVYSPNYRLRTRRLLLGNPFEYKLLRWIGTYLKSTQDALDGVFTLTASKYNLDNDFVDEAATPALTGFDKTSLTSQRLHSLILTLDKPKTALAGRTIDQYGRINTLANLTAQVGPFYMQYSTEAGQVAQ